MVLSDPTLERLAKRALHRHECDYLRAWWVALMTYPALDRDSHIVARIMLLYAIAEVGAPRADIARTVLHRLCDCRCRSG